MAREYLVTFRLKIEGGSEEVTIERLNALYQDTEDTLADVTWGRRGLPDHLGSILFESVAPVEVPRG